MFTCYVYLLRQKEWFVVLFTLYTVTTLLFWDSLLNDWMTQHILFTVSLIFDVIIITNIASCIVNIVKYQRFILH